MDLSNQDSVLHFLVLALLDAALVRILMQIIKSNGFFLYTAVPKHFMWVCNEVCFTFLYEQTELRKTSESRVGGCMGWLWLDCCCFPEFLAVAVLVLFALGKNKKNK